MIIGKGVLSSRGGHILCGSFEIAQKGSQTLIEFGRDFFFEGALAPGWALLDRVPAGTKDPHARRAAINARIGMLTPTSKEENQATEGGHSMLVPASLDVTQNICIFLWCYRKRFLLGVGLYQLGNDQLSHSSKKGERS